MNEYIVTVMARDRVGIVRDVSRAMSGIGGNITHVSQTVMRGYFTLIISVETPENITQPQIVQAIENQGKPGELEVNIRPFEKTSAEEHAPSERFTLSLQGNDSKGIISSVTGYMADKNINIDDFYAYAIEGRFVMLVQVSIPCGADVEELQSSLEKLGARYGLVVHLQHQDIFKATSTVEPVTGIQSKC
jgi:glycine cleavage system transcriptional repressor